MKHVEVVRVYFSFSRNFIQDDNGDLWVVRFKSPISDLELEHNILAHDALEAYTKFQQRARTLYARWLA